MLTNKSKSEFDEFTRIYSGIEYVNAFKFNVSYNEAESNKPLYQLVNTELVVLTIGVPSIIE